MASELHEKSPVQLFESVSGKMHLNLVLIIRRLVVCHVYLLRHSIDTVDPAQCIECVFSCGATITAAFAAGSVGESLSQV